MIDRPSMDQFRRAAARGECPWCGAPTEGLESPICSACGHHTQAVFGPADPGSPWFARRGLVVALALIISVALIQQLGGSVMKKGAAPQADAMSPPPIQVEIIAKVYTKFRASPFLKDPGLKKQLGDTAVTALAEQAKESDSDADRFRVALLAGELQDEDAAIQRLDELQPRLKEDSVLADDVRIMREIYDGEDPGPERRAQIAVNHKWIGRLAVTHDKPDTDPERARLLAGGTGLLIFSALIGFGVVVALVTGTTLLIIGIVRASSGQLRMHFVPPMPGGSIGIEMVAVFVVGFLALKGVAAAIEGLAAGKTVAASVALWTALIAQWALCLVLLWPRLRGAPKGSGLAPLGWNRGRGIVREIGAGLVGYLACLPLMAFGALITITLMVLWTVIQKQLGHKAPPAPDNPIIDLAGGKAGPLVLIMLYVLASVWAPIMEETIFRGALYRHLRSRWTWFPSAILTALCFGFMHGYQVLMLGPVIFLGFGFCLLREWRGSLIAPMTAHCFHNATVLALLIFGMKIMGE